MKRAVFMRIAVHPVMLWLGGALGALAMPPFDATIFLVPMMMQAVWALDSIARQKISRRDQLKQGFWFGWLLGFGYFTAGLWWLAYAFLVEPDQFALLIPFGIFGLPAVLALFCGGALALSAGLWSHHPLRVLTLAGVWGLFELARGVVLTGLPWNSFGLALAAWPAWAQSAALFGQPGLTVLAIFCAATPATLWDASQHRSGARWLNGAAVGVLAVMAVGGGWRLWDHPTRFVDKVRLRVLQPNIAQDDKFTPVHRDAIMRSYLSLTAGGLGPDKAGMTGVTHVIWPESAFPFLIMRDKLALQQIAALLAPDAVLVTGAVRDERLTAPEAPRRYYNAALTINAKGEVVAATDKVHLVPFGEYLPFSDLLGRLGLRQFVPSPGIFTAAAQYQFLTVPGLEKVQALICYESIFPAAVTSATHRPAVFLNLTNDAWFGVSPGPHQHFAQARLRAIEEGIPLVRSANGGISSVIDPYGRVVAGLRLGESGAFTSGLPQAIEPPVFGRFGFALPLGLMSLCIVIGLSDRLKQRLSARFFTPAS